MCGVIRISDKENQDMRGQRRNDTIGSRAVSGDRKESEEEGHPGQIGKGSFSWRRGSDGPIAR